MGYMFDNKIGTPLFSWFDADGKQWVKVTYTNDGVLNTPMIVKPSATGYTAIDLADNTQFCYLGVPDKAYTTGSEGRIQIGGPVDSMIVASSTFTANSGVRLHDGAVKTTGFGADNSGVLAPNTFGACRATAASSARQSIMLFGRASKALT